MAIQINFAKIDAEAIIDSTFDFSLVVCVLFPFFIISLSVNFFVRTWLYVIVLEAGELSIF